MTQENRSRKGGVGLIRKKRRETCGFVKSVQMASASGE